MYSCKHCDCYVSKLPALKSHVIHFHSYAFSAYKKTFADFGDKVEIEVKTGSEKEEKIGLTEVKREEDKEIADGPKIEDFMGTQKKESRYTIKDEKNNETSGEEAKVPKYQDPLIEQNTDSPNTPADLKPPNKNDTRRQKFMCDGCGAPFQKNGWLKKHRPTCSGKARQSYNYKCRDCDVTVSNPADLKRHSRVHSGERPYQCQYCGFACNQKQNLKRHIDRAHAKI